MAVPRMQRAGQWLMFARQWHIVDANFQDVFKLGKVVAEHLRGEHKPIYHPEMDCGDHVVVFNCSKVAMKGFDWKHVEFFFNKEYPKSKALIPAWEIHDYDQCRVMWMAVYKALGKVLIRRRQIERLHLFPGDTVPEEILVNCSHQIEQIQPVPKRSDEHTEAERAAFPRLLHLRDDQYVNWTEVMAPIEAHPRLTWEQRRKLKG